MKLRRSIIVEGNRGVPLMLTLDYPAGQLPESGDITIKAAGGMFVLNKTVSYAELTQALEELKKNGNEEE